MLLRAVLKFLDRKMNSAKEESATERMISVRELIARGWTRNLILRFLGEADLVAPAQSGARGRPSKFFVLDRVCEAERMPQYIAAKGRSDARATVATRFTEEKKARLLALSNSVALSGPSGTIDGILTRARQELASLDIDASEGQVRERAVDIAMQSVGHIDDDLARFNWHSGISGARIRLERRRLNAIAEKYPELAVVCANRAKTTGPS
jgi:hypothetical protein